MMLRVLGLVTVIMVMVLVVVGAPTINAQTNYTFVNELNDDMKVMMINCGGDAGRYADMYQGLKNSDYGRELNVTVGLCNHNILTYYGMCESEENVGIYVTKDGCGVAKVYLKMYDLLNETRPQSYIDLQLFLPNM